MLLVPSGPLSSRASSSLLHILFSLHSTIVSFSPNNLFRSEGEAQSGRGRSPVSYADLLSAVEQEGGNCLRQLQGDARSLRNDRGGGRDPFRGLSPRRGSGEGNERSLLRVKDVAERSEGRWRSHPSFTLWRSHRAFWLAGQWAGLALASRGLSCSSERLFLSSKLIAFSCHF